MRRTYWLAAACLSLAWPVMAQETSPSQDPGLNNPSIADRLLEQQKRTPDQTPIAPVPAKRPQTAVPGTPSPTDANVEFRGHRILPEGTFLTSCRGRLVTASGGDVILVPNDSVYAPMILLPCATLGQLRAAHQGDGDVTVSGQAFVYRDRQYLLPTYFALAEALPANPQAAATPDTPPIAEVKPPTADPSVSELIASLENDASKPRALSRLPLVGSDGSAVGGSAPPGAATATTLPEGTVLLGRRGRLVRSADAGGRLAVVFDNDPDSPSRSGPMVVLPCRAAESLEAQAATRGESVSFKLSGRVFSLEGRTYYLPTLVQATKRSDVRPLQ